MNSSQYLRLISALKVLSGEFLLYLLNKVFTIISEEVNDSFIALPFLFCCIIDANYIKRKAEQISNELNPKVLKVKINGRKS